MLCAAFFCQKETGCRSSVIPLLPFRAHRNQLAGIVEQPRLSSKF